MRRGWGRQARSAGAWALALVVALLAAGTPGPATAAINHAGVVVREGDGSLFYAYVAFAEPAIDGIALLQRTGLPVVTVGFGGLGAGVCRIGPDGCPVPECRRNLCQSGRADAPFWQYFRQQTAGDWRALTLGASATRVRDGDIDGWSWTAGAAMLPALTLDALRRLAGVDEAAAAPAGDAIPTAAVREVPAGEDRPAAPTPGWPVYAGAGAILLAIGGAAWGANRRRADSSGP
ncbi:MAG TPA: hypothetical protein VFI22_02825 [Thermomicrobiales bacterium]|nr:hypothetical protein [Thermomicrobiales bacterium]